MTIPTNKFFRLGFILGLTFVFFLGITKVSANTFSDVLVGYGYSLYENGTTGSRSWVAYNSNNLVNYGYNLGSTRYYEVDEFNFRFRPSGGFQRGSSYTITFKWYNGHSNDDITNFYPDWLLMTHELRCNFTSWNTSSQTGSSCFTSSNVYATDISSTESNTILVTVTLVPSADFYGLALINQHGSTITYYKSVGWEITDVAYSYSTDGSQDIINNQNQNTQNIINNQNSNTQDIIDNQNQNTQDIINSNQSCRMLSSSDYKFNGYLNAFGVFVSGNSDLTTDYIDITNYTSILATQVNTGTTNRICFYDKTKSKLSCIESSSLSNGATINIPLNSMFMRVCINKTTELPKIRVCQNGSQAITDALTDDDVGGSTSSASNFFSNFTTDTFGLTSVITSPLTFIQSLTSKTCSSLVLPLPYVNQNLTLPCMTTIYQTHFASFLTLYQTITFGIVSYWIVVRIFNLVKDFKNPDHDEIEVMDL